MISFGRYSGFWCMVFFLFGHILYSDPAASGKNGASSGYDPFAIDDSVERTSSTEWTFELTDYTYDREHAVSETENLKHCRIMADISIPVSHHLLFAGIEASSRFSQNHQHNEAVVRELYFEIRPDMDFGFLEDVYLRAGIQMFSWGSGVLFNPTDNLSPFNVVDPFDTYRRGVPGLKLSLSSGTQTLEIDCLGSFRQSILPDLEERFFIHSPHTIPNPFYPGIGPELLDVRFTEIDRSFEPDVTLRECQYGAKYTASIKGWDIACSYFKGYENIPLFEGEPVVLDPVGGTADIKLNYIYPEQEVTGIDISGYIGKTGLHVEYADFNMYDSGHSVGVGDEDYESIIAGIEYPFNNVFGQQDISVSLEYAREIKDEEDDRIYINRIYRDSVLLRVTHTVNFKTSGELLYVYNMDTEGSYGRLSYTHLYSDHASIKAGIDVFEGPEDCFFGEYDRNDRVFIDFKLMY